MSDEYVRDFIVSSFPEKEREAKTTLLFDLIKKVVLNEVAILKEQWMQNTTGDKTNNTLPIHEVSEVESDGNMEIEDEQNSTSEEDKDSDDWNTQMSIAKKKKRKNTKQSSDSDETTNKKGREEIVKKLAKNIETTKNKYSRDKCTKVSETQTNIINNSDKSGKKSDSPPPIIIREDIKWVEFNKDLKKENINIDSAKSVGENIKIQPTTSGDYRKLVKFLDNINMAYHTYKLKEEKTLKIVIRGIPLGVEESDIHQELQERKFPIINVRRMRLGHEKRPIPLMVAELERTAEGKRIFECTAIYNLKIQIESLRRNNQVAQCHRCQQFRHAANCCKAPPKCVKCAGDHLTSTCDYNKDKGEPTCANCNGKHPANYRGCPAFPKKQATEEEQKRNIKRSAYIQNGVSYSQATTNKNNKEEQEKDKSQETKTSSELLTVLTQLSQVLIRLIEKQNGEKNRQTQF